MEADNNEMLIGSSTVIENGGDTVKDQTEKKEIREKHAPNLLRPWLDRQEKNLDPDGKILKETIKMGTALTKKFNQLKAQSEKKVVAVVAAAGKSRGRKKRLRMFPVNTVDISAMIVKDREENVGRKSLHREEVKIKAVKIPVLKRRVTTIVTKCNSQRVDDDNEMMMDCTDLPTKDKDKKNHAVDGGAGSGRHNLPICDPTSPIQNSHHISHQTPRPTPPTSPPRSLPPPPPPKPQQKMNYNHNHNLNQQKMILFPNKSGTPIQSVHHHHRHHNHHHQGQNQPPLQPNWFFNQQQTVQKPSPRCIYIPRQVCPPGNIYQIRGSSGQPRPGPSTTIMVPNRTHYWQDVMDHNARLQQHRQQQVARHVRICYFKCPQGQQCPPPRQIISVSQFQQCPNNQTSSPART